jgi:hypothetical protein
MSEFQTPEERPVLFDRDVLIAGLEADERFRALREALDDAEKEFTEHIASTLLKSTKEIDQRKIDFTRGYFAGARHYVGGGRIEVAKQHLANQGDAKDMRPVAPPDPRRGDVV